MDESLLKTKLLRLIFPIGIIVPILLMTANFTYDEYWSLLNFSHLGWWQILTDLSLPNNHPLNTFSLKILSGISGSTFFLRLPSLICGAFIPVLCGKLAYKFSENNKLYALISAAVLVLLSAPLAVYSAVSRGYICQLFFLLLCVYGMTLVRDNPVKAAWLTGVGAIGTFLAVSSGALFLLPAGLGYLLCGGREERRCRQMWIAAGIIAVAGGIFYGINFSALRTGQQWGIEIASASQFGIFLKNSLLALIAVPSTLAALLFLWSRDHRRWVSVLLLFLPLLLAVFSNGGPERCYLYLPAALAVAGGIGLAEFFARFNKLKKLAIPAAAVLGAASFYLQFPEWKFVDYVQVFADAQNSMPPDIYPVFRASSGYPIRCGAYEEELQDNSQRLDPGRLRRIAVFECGDGIFNGLDYRGSESRIETSCRGTAGEYGNLPCRIYELHPAAALKPGEAGVIIGEKIPKELDNPGDMLYLNPWISLKKQAVFFRGEASAAEFPGCLIYRIGN